MKFNDEQKELIALLPQDVKKYGLTDSAKLVLGQIIFMYGMDFAEDNGYIYRTNDALMEDTGIASKTTLTSAIRQLVSKGLISSERGQKREKGQQAIASRYRLNKTVLEKCTCKCTVDDEQKCTEKCTSKCTIEIEDKINNMELNIKELVEVINELKNEIRDLKCTIESQKCTSKCTVDDEQNCTIDEQKCTVDVDIDVDIEKESRIKDQGNEIEHEWNEQPIDFEYKDEMKRIGLKEVGNAEVKCLAQDQDNFNDNSKKKPNGNSNTTSNTDKNKWVTWYFNEMNSNLNALATSKTKATISGLQDKIADLLQLGLDKQDDFTEKQWSVVQNFADRYIKLIEIKQSYLKNTKNTDSVQTSNNNASDVYTDDEWTSKVEQSFNASEETTKDNSSDSSREEELKPQKTEAEELNDHMMKLFAELDEQDKQNKALESKVQSTLTWDTLPF